MNFIDQVKILKPKCKMRTLLWNNNFKQMKKHSDKTSQLGRTYFILKFRGKCGDNRAGALGQGDGPCGQLPLGQRLLSHRLVSSSWSRGQKSHDLITFKSSHFAYHPCHFYISTGTKGHTVTCTLKCISHDDKKKEEIVTVLVPSRQYWNAGPQVPIQLRALVWNLPRWPSSDAG